MDWADYLRYEAANSGNLPKPPKTPSSSTSFLSWQQLVRKWLITSRIACQAGKAGATSGRCSQPSSNSWHSSRLWEIGDTVGVLEGGENQRANSWFKMRLFDERD